MEQSIDHAKHQGAVGPSRRLLVLVFTCGLAARGLVLGFGPMIDPARATLEDSTRYLALGETLRSSGRFAAASGGGYFQDTIVRLRDTNGTLPPPDAQGLRPESFRTPGYPVVIALLLTVFDDIRAVLLVQCLLGALLAVAVLFISSALGLPPKMSMLAGLLWALHPGLVVSDNLILTESLFNACAVVAVLIAVRAESSRGLLLAGTLVGVASLLRPPLGLFYLPALAALTWTRVRARLLAVVCLVTTATLPCGLWAIRNHAVGEGLRLTTVGDMGVMFYTLPYTMATERGEDWDRSWRTHVDQFARRLQRRLGPGDDVIAVGRRLAIRELTARPAAAAKVFARSLVKLAAGHSLDALYHALGRSYEPSGLFARFVLREKSPTPDGGMPTIAAALFLSGLNLVIALAALVGLICAVWRRNWTLAIAGGLTAVLFTAATGAVGQERLRLPMMLPLFLLAGSASAPGLARSRDAKKQFQESQRDAPASTAFVARWPAAFQRPIVIGAHRLDHTTFERARWRRCTASSSKTGRSK